MDFSPPHNRKSLLLPAALAVPTLLDGVLTLWGLRLGAIEEDNPLMRWLIDQNAVAFTAVKLALPVLLGVLLCRIGNRPHALVSRLLVVAVPAYDVVLVTHAQWILRGR
ncbi:Hypothetical protein DEACI_0955 [Acididesulfobacillus acetoxydans]|uniref:DUF5658 domain-containing protein n=1 Tax=Acididesulfobacillus acetoxydans TaxID=1561005 RepID=A0A8S0VW14_9FIRM|nr:DUF5658 family protein [Acididesulfobacillus acetoxydans]CAA7600303.1 Hypothetical protein DEACI_0955 [Acididesulfobacillus acetoxydans]CEJ06079.1 Hypothetical protein DEACI_0525 [Acididesulfobacillus acetoxydans]